MNSIKRHDGQLTKEGFRTMIVKAEKQMMKTEGAFIGHDSEEICPLKHSFGDGIYVREIFNPKGALIITKIHKKTHPFFLLKGKMWIVTEKGIKLVKAPYQGMTKAGTKRAIYAIEDVIFITVHVTENTDLDEIEDEIISKNFEEYECSISKVLDI